MLTLSPTLTPRSLRVAPDVTLEYVEHGAPTGVPVVMLHGTSDSWRSFEGAVTNLPESMRAIAVSLRGHGDSSRPRVGYQPDDFDYDLCRLLDELGIPSAVVVGHSMGTTVALHFAIRYPERTRGLVLIDAFADPATNRIVADLWNTVAAMRDPIDPAFVREFQVSTVAGPVAPELIDTAVAESLKVPAFVWRASVAGMLSTSFAGRLDRIAAPTLLLWGDHDAFIGRAEQDALVAGIRESRLVVYEGAGHAPHWEQPARVAADLTAFCQDVYGRF